MTSDESGGSKGKKLAESRPHKLLKISKHNSSSNLIRPGLEGIEVQNTESL